MPHGTSIIAERAVTTKTPRAFSVPPSGNWDGNDGAWSTFIIRVGTPAQLFRVLPSTTGPETWIPIPDHCERGESWCGNARGVEPFNGASSGPFSGSPNELLTTSLDPGMTCTANRSPMCIHCPGSINGKCTVGPCTGRNCCGDPPGSCSGVGCNGLNGICTGAYIGCPCVGVDWNASANVSSSAGILNAAAASGFQPNQSSTWSALGSYQLTTEGNLRPQGSGQVLNLSALGQYGADVVGLGVDAAAGFTLNNTLVAGILTEPYYIGTLGLVPVQRQSLDNASTNFMMLLKEQNLIPSLSYGYTAGAIYRQPPVLASLTLGGYDSLRLQPDFASFDFPPMSSYNLSSLDPGNLTVGIQSITASDTLTGNVTLLSVRVTALIDTTLPFIWLPLSACQVFEKAFGLTWHDAKEIYMIDDSSHQQLLNANPSVTFVLAKNSTSPSTNITLPYASFNLQASNPIFPNGTNYFPLRRATNESQYTLGRTFLQEAFLFVDYEQFNFSISQAQFPANASPNLILVDHSPRLSSSEHNVSKTHMKEIIIGVVVGISLAIAILYALFIFRRHRRRKEAAQAHCAADTGEGKDSWPSSPDSHTTEPFSPRGESGGFTSMSEMDGSIPKIFGELEDPRSTKIETLMSNRTPSGKRKPRQELPGTTAANELQQAPSEKEKVYELATGGTGSPRRKGLRVRENFEQF